MFGFRDVGEESLRFPETKQVLTTTVKIHQAYTSAGDFFLFARIWF